MHSYLIFKLVWTGKTPWPSIIIIIISTIFIQDSLFSKDITAITKGPVKIKVCKVKEKRSK